MLDIARVAQDVEAREFAGMGSLKLVAPAKVNLYLNVKGVRDDGYHEVSTTMHALMLHDVLRMKARYFDQDGTTDDRIEDIPAEYAEAAQIARDRLCDLVAEADDDLMMKYLDGSEQLTQEELESLLDKAIAQELFIPVYVVPPSSSRVSAA